MPIELKVYASTLDEYVEILSRLLAPIPAATVQPVQESEPPVHQAQAQPETPVEEPAAEPGPETQADAELKPNGHAEPEENPFADAAPKKQKVKKLTRDDVNQAFSAYIRTYGQANAMQDVTAMLDKHFGVRAIKLIPADQESFAKAIAVVNAAIVANEFNRERISA